MSSDEGEAEAAAVGFWTGPKADVKYPLTVLYCGECSMPLEYCEYWPAGDKCKEWAIKNAPDALGKLTVSDEAGAKEGGVALKREAVVEAVMRKPMETRKENGRLAVVKG